MAANKEEEQRTATEPHLPGQIPIPGQGEARDAAAADASDGDDGDGDGDDDAGRRPMLPHELVEAYFDGHELIRPPDARFLELG
eukprot:COSAG01_NODE_7239_length_3288_cov_159.102854_3_plen_83_part_01